MAESFSWFEEVYANIRQTAQTGYSDPYSSGTAAGLVVEDGNGAGAAMRGAGAFSAMKIRRQIRINDIKKIKKRG